MIQGSNMGIVSLTKALNSFAPLTQADAQQDTAPPTQPEQQALDLARATHSGGGGQHHPLEGVSAITPLVFFHRLLYTVQQDKEVVTHDARGTLYGTGAGAGSDRRRRQRTFRWAVW